MKIEEQFPFMVCLNPARREAARRRMSEQFRMHRLPVARFTGGGGTAGSRHLRGFAGLRGRGECLLFLRAVRAAAHRRERAVLVFDDTAELHGDFRERLTALELPEDWGILLLGGLHTAPPRRVSEGLVRVAGPVAGVHAAAVHARCFKEVLRRGRRAERVRHPSGGAAAAADCALSGLYLTVPVYAAFPGLAAPHSGEVL